MYIGHPGGWSFNFLSVNLRVRDLHDPSVSHSCNSFVHKLDYDPELRFQILEYVQSCYHEESGGFSPTPLHDPQLLTTLSAVQIAVTLDAIDILDKAAIVKYIVHLQVMSVSQKSGNIK